ncbi:MAG: malate:quinone oxidoreductase, partial [Gillisia sp.]
MSSQKHVQKEYDLICVGGGIMSATLSLMLKLLNPAIKIAIFERLPQVAQESTAAWNNAGTGHSALCELNYTPKQKDGSINISKAIEIFTQFEQSKEFWSYLVKQHILDDPQRFIHSIPHHSWVRGKENADFLEKRYKAMTASPLFETMKFTREISKMKEWFPLIAENRDASEEMAATRMEIGT